MMEGKKINMQPRKPRALLVFGAPCSGKTTFSEKFAERYKLTYYDLGAIIREHELSREMMLMILELITRTNQNLVLEGCIDTEEERNEMRKILRIAGYIPSLVWIQTDISTIRSRLKSRHKTVAEAKEFFESATALIEAPSEVEFPIILSGKHTFDTQAKHVITALADI